MNVGSRVRFWQWAGVSQGSKSSANLIERHQTWLREPIVVGQHRAQDFVSRNHIGQRFDDGARRCLGWQIEDSGQVVDSATFIDPTQCPQRPLLSGGGRCGRPDRLLRGGCSARTRCVDGHLQVRDRRRLGHHPHTDVAAGAFGQQERDMHGRQRVRTDVEEAGLRAQTGRRHSQDLGDHLCHRQHRIALGGDRTSRIGGWQRAEIPLPRGVQRPGVHHDNPRWDEVSR